MDNFNGQQQQNTQYGAQPMQNQMYASQEQMYQQQPMQNQMYQQPVNQGVQGLGQSNPGVQGLGQPMQGNAQGQVFSNPYYNPNTVTRKSNFKWILLGGVALVLGLIILGISLIIGWLFPSYDVSDIKQVQKAADKVLDMDLEKMSDSMKDKIYGDEAKKAWHGTAETDDTGSTLVVIQFKKEKYAKEYLEDYKKSQNKKFENLKEDGEIGKYSWSTSGKKCVYSWVNTELSDEYDCEYKVRTIMYRDDEYVMLFSVLGSNDDKEVDDLYKDFLDKIE